MIFDLILNNMVIVSLLLLVMIPVLGFFLLKEIMSPKQFLIASVIVVFLVISVQFYVDEGLNDKATIFCESNGYELEKASYVKGFCFHVSDSTISRVNIEYVNGRWYFIQDVKAIGVKN